MDSYSAKESLPSRLRSARSKPTVSASWPAASALETKPSPSMSRRRNTSSLLGEAGCLAVAPPLADAAAGRKRSCDCPSLTFIGSACAAATATRRDSAITLLRGMVLSSFAYRRRLHLACPNIWLHIRTDRPGGARVNWRHDTRPDPLGRTGTPRRPRRLAAAGSGASADVQPGGARCPTRARRALPGCGALQHPGRFHLPRGRAP